VRGSRIPCGAGATRVMELIPFQRPLLPLIYEADGQNAKEQQNRPKADTAYLYIIGLAHMVSFIACPIYASSVCSVWTGQTTFSEICSFLRIGDDFGSLAESDGATSGDR
jgi:hypothetical protein